jgi:hypothetical protein
MSVEEVGKKWGEQQKFSSEVFKSGSEKMRSTMAYDLLKHQNPFIGKDPTDIRKELGDFDGFYFSDMFPTYMIEESNTKEKGSWQIVFLLDSKQKVDEVIVHKNCCEQ